MSIEDWAQISRFSGHITHIVTAFGEWHVNEQIWDACMKRAHARYPDTIKAIAYRNKLAYRYASLETAARWKRGDI